MSEIEILEISQWLHDKGFGCDKAAYIGGDYPLLYDMRDPPAKMVDGKFVEPWDKEVKPFMTLTRALELLPALINNTSLIYEKCEGEIGYFVDPDNCLLSEDCRKDLHLAALRLLKQVVEKGYLDAERSDAKGESDG